MNKSEAKIEVQRLVDKFDRLSTYEKRHYNEANTRKNFILPLFRALGWDVFDDYLKDEVVEEETSISGRLDYAFKLNGNTQFILEAKALPEDLDKEQWARQALEYGWNKGISWVILTDFEGLKVFNSEWEVAHPRPNLDFKYSEYLDRFDDLWLLSKESTKGDELDKQAQKWGITAKRESVNDVLARDLLEWREELTKNFVPWNKEKNTEIIEESVQRILDRLVFMRVVEDRGIEEKRLWQTYQEWEKNDNLPQNFIEKLIPLFRQFNKDYDSNLFEPHVCEKLYTTQEPFKKIIPDLYADKETGVKYRFDAINTDVLGQVYEQYLGYVQGREGDKSKRKKSGIYYTPSYIVDYIVRQTLAPVLEKCRSIDDLKKIKVLDPACGSGSFLIRALDVIYEKYKDFNSANGAFTKLTILQENLYGVDLDFQAVEIARLNLLISSCDRQIKLPLLSNNIKRGNSLISDKKVSQDAFNWEDEFPEVFKQGGFDVIVGNPPYIRNREILDKDKRYFSYKYLSATGQYDIYQLFYELALNILKKDGLLGFITSNKYAIADYGKSLREFILKNAKIFSILDVSNLKVFKDAATYPYIIILQKNPANNGNKIVAVKSTESNLFGEKILLSQDEISKSSTKNFVIKNEPSFLKRIEQESVKLGEIATIKETIHTGNIRSKLITSEPVDQNCKKLLAGKDCHRYWFEWNGKYIRYDKGLIDKPNGDYANLVEPKYFENPKILLREIALRVECYLDNEKYYTLNKVYSIQPFVKDYNLLYLLALLNSRLISFYFRSKFEEAHVGSGYLQFKKIYTSQIPIRQLEKKSKIQTKSVKTIIKLAKDISNLYKALLTNEENSDKWRLVKLKIERTDSKIDEEVYKLYDLTDREINIVEGGENVS